MNKEDITAQAIKDARDSEVVKEYLEATAPQVAENTAEIKAEPHNARAFIARREANQNAEASIRAYTPLPSFQNKLRRVIRDALAVFVASKGEVAYALNGSPITTAKEGIRAFNELGASVQKIRSERVLMIYATATA